MKTVIEMARSVGARPEQKKNCDAEYLMSIESLERFAERIRADEREAIIQKIPGGYSVDPQWVCDMIRARAKETT